VESDEPVAFGGKGYQWAQTVDITAGRDVVLELTAANAEVGAAPAPSAPGKTIRRCSCRNGKDSLVAIWTPESRASGFVVDPAGLVMTNQRVSAAHRRWRCSSRHPSKWRRAFSWPIV
jgi:hypothetical protein